MRTPGQLMAERSERERLDIHNRLTLFPPLEDAPTNEQEYPKNEQPNWNRKQWDIVLQLQARVLHCENKVTELLSSFKKRKRTSRYD